MFENFFENPFSFSIIFGAVVIETEVFCQLWFVIIIVVNREQTIYNTINVFGFMGDICSSFFIAGKLVLFNVLIVAP